VVSTKREDGEEVAIGLETGLRSTPEASSPKPEWKPGPGEWAILTCLAIVSLVVALDATILVPVLPVCSLLHRPTLNRLQDVLRR
jgi:hypothetical protein